MPAPRLFALLGCLFALVPARADIVAAPEEGIVAANARLGRGVNFGNTLEAPAEGAWGVSLKAEYFRLIREAGFDSVRLPVRWSAHAAAEPPYAIDPTFAARVDWAIEQATANGLNIIVNVHHYLEMDAAPDGNLVRLTALWAQIAARYRDRPASVYFELYNEPHDKLTREKWDAAIPVLLAAVRKTNPVRPVIIGPASWNSIGALDALQLPADDRHLIVTVHYYEPFQFTHQGANWVDGADKWSGREWIGNEKEQADVRRELEHAARWGREHGRPIYLGEFGVFNKADMASRVRWTRFLTREAKRLGFSRAYWEFCSGFGVYDAKAATWNTPIKAALLDD
jgi:endoglucanase